MTDLIKQAIIGQFEASLAMLNDCIRQCPPEHWEQKIGNDSFRQVVYHTLFWADCYLSSSKEAFALRDLHERGGDEQSSTMASKGLTRDESLTYLKVCRKKMIEALEAETETVLISPSGFPGQQFSRFELHVYNIRHIQHHTGQLSAYLRRIGLGAGWVKSRWR